jgi:hypothetical protein
MLSRASQFHLVHHAHVVPRKTATAPPASNCWLPTSPTQRRRGGTHLNSITPKTTDRRTVPPARRCVTTLTSAAAAADNNNRSMSSSSAASAAAAAARPGVAYSLGRTLYLALTNRSNAMPITETRGPSFAMPPSSGFRLLPEGRVARTLGCQIGYMDHTGCHLTIRPTRVATPGCQICYMDHTGRCFFTAK